MPKNENEAMCKNPLEQMKEVEHEGDQGRIVSKSADDTTKRIKLC